jgi:hypothetical protein
MARRQPPSYAAPDADEPCLTSIGNLSEGAQIPVSFSQGSAVRPSFGAQHGNFNAVGHMQLLHLAADAHMTPRAYVLFALKDSGLDVKGDHPRKARIK